MQIMDRKEQLAIIYDYLRSKGIVHTKKEFAQALDMNYSTVSNAFGGNEKCLTDSLFISRIGSTFSETFNKEWLRTGNGPMLKQEVSDICTNNVNEESNDIQSLRQMVIILQKKCSEQDSYIQSLLEIISNLSKRQ